MAKEHKDFVVGLDIGTFKMKVVVAELSPQAQLRVVVPARYTASSVIIASGLAPGDRVITAGVSKLRSGEQVIAGEEQP